FSCPRSSAPRQLHSLPTRRSSDLLTSGADIKAPVINGANDRLPAPAQHRAQEKLCEVGVRFGLFLLMWSWVSLAQAVTVVASIEPLAMLAREVLGDQAEVSTLLLPNQTPHFAAFTPGQARQVRDAELVIWLGHEAEPNVEG